MRKNKEIEIRGSQGITGMYPVRVLKVVALGIWGRVAGASIPYGYSGYPFPLAPSLASSALSSPPSSGLFGSPTATQSLPNPQPMPQHCRRDRCP